MRTTLSEFSDLAGTLRQATIDRTPHFGAHYRSIQVACSEHLVGQPNEMPIALSALAALTGQLALYLNGLSSVDAGELLHWEDNAERVAAVLDSIEAGDEHEALSRLSARLAWLRPDRHVN